MKDISDISRFLNFGRMWTHQSVVQPSVAMGIMMGSCGEPYTPVVRFLQRGNAQLTHQHILKAKSSLKQTSFSLRHSNNTSYFPTKKNQKKVEKDMDKIGTFKKNCKGYGKSSVLTFFLADPFRFMFLNHVERWI